MSAVRLAVSPSIDRDGTILVFSPTAAAVSTDDGKTFRGLQLPGGKDLVSVALDPEYWRTSYMLLGMLGSGTARSEIAKSIDGGKNFLPLAGEGLGATQIWHVLILSDGRVLGALSGTDAAGNFGIRCSTDGGTSWHLAC
jgi:hypothetical protein